MDIEFDNDLIDISEGESDLAGPIRPHQYEPRISTKDESSLCTNEGDSGSSAEQLQQE